MAESTGTTGGTDARETQFEDTKSGWQARWGMEFGAARKEIEKWHQTGEKVVRRFLGTDERKNDAEQRWNFFAANVITQKSMLYGKTPTTEVSRRFGDAKDAVARVAGEILERLLNTDIERDSDTFKMDLDYALGDRLLPGMATVRLHYTANFKTDSHPALTRKDEAGNEVLGEDGQPQVLAEAYEEESKENEDCLSEYVHWKDSLWSPARTFQEVRWWAFRSEMSREQLEEKFGPEMAKLIPLNAKRAGKGDKGSGDAQRNDPWGRAEVWEIWDKEGKQVFWYVDGMHEVLTPVGVEASENGAVADPLGLDSFWPFARPVVANVTTSNFMPRPDFKMAEDLYNEIDAISTRITLLERAIRAVGVYDKNSPELKRMLTEATENQMLPVENWMAFSEKGGIKGAVDWMPLDQITLALTALRDYRSELVQALYQLTGMSDLVRGQQTENGTPGEAQVKARFASVRLQALQDEFARFASDTLALKAEIIAKHFDPMTIVDRSNARYCEDDPQLVMAAVQFIKSNHSAYRVVVKPESVSMTDFAAMKAERTEWVAAVGGFMQSTMPLLQVMPNSLPFVLEILKWTLASVKGSSTIEGVFDRAIQEATQAAQQPKPPPPPDPKLQAAQMKAQADMAKIDKETQAEMQRATFETQQIGQRQANDAALKVKVEAIKAHLKAGGSPGLLPPGNGVPGGGL